MHSVLLSLCGSIGGVDLVVFFLELMLQVTKYHFVSCLLWRQKPLGFGGAKELKETSFLFIGKI